MQDSIGLRITESLEGWIGKGISDPIEGRVEGEKAGTTLTINVKIEIEHLHRFLQEADHRAKIDGVIHCQQLGGDIPFSNGSFNVFSINAQSGERQMEYVIAFKNSKGEEYFLYGKKRIVDDPGFDILEDLTTLFTTVYVGKDNTGKVFGAGQLYFHLLNTPAMIASLEVTGATWFGAKFAAISAFVSFAMGNLRDTYLEKIRLLYDATYENLVVSGNLTDSDGKDRPFCFVSGVHSKNFPWGDDEGFSDVLLVIGSSTGQLTRYAISKRVLNELKLDVDAGVYEYDGPIFFVDNSASSIAFTEMWAEDCAIPCGRAKISFRFEPKAHGLTPLPFRELGAVFDSFSLHVQQGLRAVLPETHQLGVEITPYSIFLKSGSCEILMAGKHESYALDPQTSWAEAEVSSFKNVREPTLCYGYICAIRPPSKSARIQLHTNALRNDRSYWGKDRLDCAISAVISHLASKEIAVTEGGLEVKDLLDGEATPFVKLGVPFLEVRNDHYPTGTFMRRIIQVLDSSGETCFALEEDMDMLRTEPIDSTEETVVASIRNADKFVALKTALLEAKFYEVLEAKWAGSGKTREEFSIVIKPNFMFAYNKRDFSTYVDPQLVDCLVAELCKLGYRKIFVVEAHSTYGEYFDKRDVRSVAEYVGYSVDESLGYKLVDLTLDASETLHLGPHLGYHPVPLTWRDADFRISFAKNKTHCYAFYTLTLKNIYGSLALANKFKEYHCNRGIYESTIEYLQKYPVDFGIVDGFLSADGPFGIFADSDPNKTETILAGANLVAVDWVGASKMGLDPKISRYMQLAVSAFGKPRIRIVGDSSIYKPWLNVPMALVWFANDGLDVNEYFGNIFYMATTYMDTNQFTYKSKSEVLKLVRKAIEPIQTAVFLQAGGERTRLNRLVSSAFRWLGQGP